MPSVTTKATVASITLTPGEWAKIEALIRVLGAAGFTFSDRLNDAYHAAADVRCGVTAATHRAEARG